MLWTKAQIEALTALWAAHTPPAKIAAELNELYGTNRTEAAIRTKAINLGLPKLGVRTRRSLEAAKVIALAAAPVVEEVAAPVIVPEPAPLVRPRGVLLQDLHEPACHYPISEDRSGRHLMCGEVREDLSPYCTEHRDLCCAKDRKGQRQPHYPGWPRPNAPAGKPAIGNVPRGGR